MSWCSHVTIFEFVYLWLPQTDIPRICIVEVDQSAEWGGVGRGGIRGRGWLWVGRWGVLQGGRWIEAGVLGVVSTYPLIPTNAIWWWGSLSILRNSPPPPPVGMSYLYTMVRLYSESVQELDLVAGKMADCDQTQVCVHILCRICTKKKKCY